MSPCNTYKMLWQTSQQRFAHKGSSCRGKQHLHFSVAKLEGSRAVVLWWGQGRERTQELSVWHEAVLPSNEVQLGRNQNFDSNHIFKWERKTLVVDVMKKSNKRCRVDTWEDLKGSWELNSYLRTLSSWHEGNWDNSVITLPSEIMWSSFQH